MITLPLSSRLHISGIRASQPHGASMGLFQEIQVIAGGPGRIVSRTTAAVPRDTAIPRAILFQRTLRLATRYIP
jgi:hypothetical protein